MRLTDAGPCSCDTESCGAISVEMCRDGGEGRVKARDKKTRQSEGATHEEKRVKLGINCGQDDLQHADAKTKQDTLSEDVLPILFAHTGDHDAGHQ